MKKHDFIDIRVFLDEIFGVAENFKDAFTKEFGQWECCEPNSKCCQDFYPAYAYPPVNVYITENRTMVIQFALAGFAESDITLEFRGDYLVFSADISNDFEPEEHVKYFKKRLKLKSIQDQRYFVPADKYYQDKVTAVFNNAILTVTILPRDQVKEDEGVKVNIKTEKQESGQK